MKLRDIFEQLSEGEFRQLALGGSEASGILPANFGKVIPHINLALTEIYKRFPIKRKQVLIQQMEQITEYVLHERYAQSNTASLEPWKYIIDSEFKPFNNGDEVLLIEAVYDEEGDPYPLNDETEVYSVYTPTHRSVQVPFNDSNNRMVVIYRADHPKLQKTLGTDEEVLDQEVEITTTYLQPLLLFIAGRYLTSSGNAESVVDGNNFLQRFELSCNDINRLGLTVTENPTNEKAIRRGWA